MADKITIVVAKDQAGCIRTIVRNSRGMTTKTQVATAAFNIGLDALQQSEVAETKAKLISRIGPRLEKARDLYGSRALARHRPKGTNKPRPVSLDAAGKKNLPTRLRAGVGMLGRK